MRLRGLLILAAAIALPLPAIGTDPESPETLAARAFEEVRTFTFKNGYDLYSQALTGTARGSEIWEMAVFGKAVCAQQISPPTQTLIEEASTLYNQLLTAAPQSRYAPRARMNLGRIAELVDFGGDKPDLPTARGHYTKVIETYPTRPIAGEATLRLAATYIQSYEKDQVLKGIDLLRQWLAEHPKDHLATTMWQYAGEAYFRPLNDYAKSLECYEKAEAIGFAEKGREGPFYWRMARMAHRLMDRLAGEGKAAEATRRRAQAVEYYTKIIKVAPTSGKAYESQLYLKALGAPVPKIKLFEKLKEVSKAVPEARPAPVKKEQASQ